MDLSKRTCDGCGSFNPFFISSSFVTAKPVKQQALLANEEEVTEHKTINTAPFVWVAESSHQVEAGRIKSEEEKSENELMTRERVERERAELDLKNEIKQVKEETEQYKQETLNLVKEVREELQQIEQENKLLKEQVETLNKTGVTGAARENLAMPSTQPSKSASGANKVLAVAFSIVLILTCGCVIFYFTEMNGRDVITEPPVAKTNVSTVGAEQKKTVQPAAEIKTDENKTATASDQPVAPVKAPLADLATSAIEKEKNTGPVTNSVPAPVQTKPVQAQPSGVFMLSEARVRNDLIGRKLSGCGITIGSASEIEKLGNLVFVEKLSSVYLKYKVSLKVKQGNETYSSTPYVYYSSDGSFIKIDGTNCE